MSPRPLQVVGLTLVLVGGPSNAALAQVTEGNVEVVNVRETDPTLGPLVMALVALGVVTLLATVLFWWLTRPDRSEAG